jgi:hypothetical protein
LPRIRSVSTIPLDSSSMVRRVGSSVAPGPKRAGSNPGDDAESAVLDPIGHDPGDVVEVAGVLLEEDVAVSVDGDVVRAVELRLSPTERLAPIEEQGQRGPVGFSRDAASTGDTCQ